MKTLWFKQCHVSPILAGEKTDTIRRKSGRLPNEGDIVALSVGPRLPFCTAEIMRREPIDLSALSPTRRDEVLGIYVDETGPMTRLTFRILDTPMRS